MTLLILLLILTVLYSSFILWCWNGWKKNSRQAQRSNVNALNVDVIVAIRNEERTILHLLGLLAAQKYVKSNFRLVIVDDHSTDSSARIVNDFFQNHPAVNGILLNAEGSGKKAAMAQAIRQSKAKLILTTDGDCMVGENWIRSMTEPFSDHEISFVAGPVLLTGNSGLLSLMQRMEMIGLTGIAGASILQQQAMMCNGANLCFRKSAYDKVEGYSGSQFASGDDTQLMRKFNSENPHQLTFVKNSSALVKSFSEQSVSSFWNQRRRWATKIPFTLSFFTVFIAVISFAVHIGLLTGMISLFFNAKNVILFFPVVVLKVIPEIIFLKKVGNDLGQKTFSPAIALIQPLYWLYISLIGLAVPFATYQWKGRKIK